MALFTINFSAAWAADRSAIYIPDHDFYIPPISGIFIMPTRIYSWQHLDQKFQDQGRDTPERIKKAIAAFQIGCGIKYVMLVGDSDRFPVRYCRVWDPTHWGNGYMPSDLYYIPVATANNTRHMP